MKVQRDFGANDDSQTVIVPRNDKALVAVAPERVRRLREHLIKTLREMRAAKPWVRFASPARAGTHWFRGPRGADSLFSKKGWCCRNGDDDAFLDDRTLARVRLTRPDITERALLRLYLDRVPAVAYRDSCIFHGERGCTLDRSLRSDICNSYYCGDLGAYMKASTSVPTRVIAGEGDKMRTSPVLMPIRSVATTKSGALTRGASLRACHRLGWGRTGKELDQLRRHHPTLRSRGRCAPRNAHSPLSRSVLSASISPLHAEIKCKGSGLF